MSKKKYKTSQVYLENIVDHCRKILEYAQDITQEQLENRDMEFDAIVQRFQAIGENISKIENGHDRIIDHFPEAIDWVGLKRLRDVISHNYEGLVEASILKYCQEQVGPTKDGILRILKHRYGI